MKRWVVYALKDPCTDAVRYVGWTSASLSQRLANHCHQARRDGRTHKDRWILSLSREGLKPVVETLESGAGEGWFESERKWILLFRSAGMSLINRTDGGEGAPGFIHTEESRRKRAVAMTGRKMPREGVERQAAQTRGRKVCRELVERRAAKLRGRKLSIEVRTKMSDARKGWNPSTEVRSNMAAGQRERFKKHNPPRPRKVMHQENTVCVCVDCVKSRVGNPVGRKRFVVHDPENRCCYCMDCRIARKGRPIGAPRKPTACRKCGELCKSHRVAEKHCSPMKLGKALKPTTCKKCGVMCEGARIALAHCRKLP